MSIPFQAMDLIFGRVIGAQLICHIAILEQRTPHLGSFSKVFGFGVYY